MQGAFDMKKLVLFTLSIATLACAAGPALADAADNVIKARRSYMQVVLFNARPLFGMIQVKVKYDAKKAQIAADNLKALAAMNNGAMWPKGSDNTAK
jgi:cytochrome c556